MITTVNNSPTLRILLILDKRMDYSRHNLWTRLQHKTIPNHACTIGFKVSTMKLWAVEEWNSLKQITILLQSSQLEKHFKIFENKNIAYLLLFVVLSNHSVYVVFLDPHQGIDDFAFFLPTFKSLCGAQVGMNMETYLHCIYCKVKTRIRGEKCHTLRSRCACGWIYIYIYGG